MPSRRPLCFLGKDNVGVRGQRREFRVVLVRGGGGRSCLGGISRLWQLDGFDSAPLQDSLMSSYRAGRRNIQEVHYQTMRGSMMRSWYRTQTLLPPSEARVKCVSPSPLLPLFHRCVHSHRCWSCHDARGIPRVLRCDPRISVPPGNSTCPGFLSSHFNYLKSERGEKALNYSSLFFSSSSFW